MRGICAEVHNDLLYFGGVCKNRIRQDCHIHNNLSAGRDGRSQELCRLLYDGREGEGFSFVSGLTGKSEDLTNEVTCPE